MVCFTFEIVVVVRTPALKYQGTRYLFTHLDEQHDVAVARHAVLQAVVDPHDVVLELFLQQEVQRLVHLHCRLEDHRPAQDVRDLVQAAVLGYLRLDAWAEGLDVPEGLSITSERRK